jgi:hypothetical protein
MVPKMIFVGGKKFTALSHRGENYGYFFAEFSSVPSSAVCISNGLLQACSLRTRTSHLLLCIIQYSHWTIGSRAAADVIMVPLARFTLMST